MNIYLFDHRNPITMLNCMFWHQNKPKTFLSMGEEIQQNSRPNAHDFPLFSSSTTVYVVRFENDWVLYSRLVHSRFYRA